MTLSLAHARKMTLGVLVGNRDFFPDALITEARRDLTKLFSELGIAPIWLAPEESKLGAVETWSDAVRCGELFRKHRECIDGILVCLPNFGDEKGVADSVRLSELQVPILGAGLPGRPRSIRSGTPARCLLRKNLCLQ